MNTPPKHLSFEARFLKVLCWVISGPLALLLLSPMAWALDINQASEAELDSLKGMGPALSAKVLEARAQGPFLNWLDVMQRVSGLRQAKAQQFSEQGLTVQGLPFNTTKASSRQ
jgi:competence protein ComEA